jgi:hypothetical protein
LATEARNNNVEEGWQKKHTIKAAIKQASKQTNKQKVFQDAQRLETTAQETDAVLEEWRQRSPRSACCRHFDNPKVQKKKKKRVSTL